MSLFKTILSKIFRDQAPAAAPSASPASPPPPQSDVGRGAALGASAGAAAGAAFGHAAATPSQTPGQTVPIGAAAPSAPVDVAAVMDGLAASNPEKLDWKRSIVDLMKLLDMDSSLSSRKELAAELGYSGDTADSAKMNVWLHQQVLKKVAENGGKVPAELLA